MTSTISASDLLKFFVSLVFTVFVDLLCASASVEHVRRDLELMNVVQHCRNLVALRCVKLISLCWSPSLCGVRLPPTSPLPSYNPENSLVKSILLFEGPFQRHAPDFGSHRFLYKLGISIFF